VTERTDVIATVTDPKGREVDLTATQWAHVVKRRGRLARLQDVILKAVTEPDAVVEAPDADNELWYYIEHAGPTRWLRVVVAYEGDRGFIVTAFPRHKRP
jgi:hypothetical protein